MSFLKKEKNISILKTNDLKFFKGGLILIWQSKEKFVTQKMLAKSALIQ